MASRSRRSVARYLEKYLFNPPMRLAMRLGVAPANVALLETTGRRTGLARQTPVSNGLDGDTFWLVSEHGDGCAYVRNLTANPRVRVRVKASRGRWRTGTAHPMPDDDALARRRRVEAPHGLSGRVDGWIFAKNATNPLTIRIDLEPEIGAR